MPVRAEVEISLEIDPTFNPSQSGLSQDNRNLGVPVKRLWLDSAA